MSICPGSVRTPAWDHRLAADPGLLAKVAPHYPLGRLVDSGGSCRTAAVSRVARFGGITGTVLPVDAGLTAGNLAFVTGVLG